MSGSGANMRILQLHTRYRQPGGEDVVVQAEAELLRHAGHEVVQYQAENPHGAGATVAALARAPWNATAARTVTRIAERLRPDVAHVHNTWFALSPAVLPALRRAGVPVVMTIHNYRLLCLNALLFRDGRPCEDCVGAAPWKGLRHRCYHGSAALSATAAATVALHARRGTWWRDVDVFLAPSAFARSLLLRGGLPAGRVRVKPSFTADPGPRARAVEDSPTVLYLGRLSQEKGVDLLLDAWQRRRDQTLELLVAGDGPLSAALEPNRVPGVRFLGRLAPEEVRALLLGARALVFPSRCYEVQPMAVLEALAAGLPVLASGHGGLPELVRPLGDGWLVGEATAPAWAAALGRLGDPRLVRRAGGAARRLYERSFTEAAAAQALVSAYEDARRPPLNPERPSP